MKGVRILVEKQKDFECLINVEVDGDGSGECGENADKLWEFEMMNILLNIYQCSKLIKYLVKITHLKHI